MCRGTCVPYIFKNFVTEQYTFIQTLEVLCMIKIDSVLIERIEEVFKRQRECSRNRLEDVCDWLQATQVNEMLQVCWAEIKTNIKYLICDYVVFELNQELDDQEQEIHDFHYSDMCCYCYYRKMYKPRTFQSEIFGELLRLAKHQLPLEKTNKRKGGDTIDMLYKYMKSQFKHTRCAEVVKTRVTLMIGSYKHYLDRHIDGATSFKEILSGKCKHAQSNAI